MGFVVFHQPARPGRNSGVMIHAASLLSMTVTQEWPVSMEMQFLCAATKAGRPTGTSAPPAPSPAGGPLQLSSGHIALQAESQPVWFRNIRLKVLP